MLPPCDVHLLCNRDDSSLPEVHNCVQVENVDVPYVTAAVRSSLLAHTVITYRPLCFHRVMCIYCAIEMIRHFLKCITVCRQQLAPTQQATTQRAFPTGKLAGKQSEPLVPQTMANNLLQTTPKEILLDLTPRLMVHTHQTTVAPTNLAYLPQACFNVKNRYYELQCQLHPKDNFVILRTYL